MEPITPVPDFDPRSVADILYVLQMAKYVALGKFTQGFVDFLKRIFKLDTRFSADTRDWAYPLIAFGVMAGSVVGLHVLLGQAFDEKLIREMIIGTVGTWAALVGIVSAKNAHADRAAGKDA